MVVEDCEALSYVFARLLSNLGFEVEEHPSAIDALAAWKATRAVDLIVTDVTLPGLTGVEFLRRLNQQNELGAAGVLVVTAATAVRPPLPGAVMLSKPFSVADFEQAVERALAFPQMAGSAA